jgi:hypothetical protein
MAGMTEGRREGGRCWYGYILPNLKRCSPGGSATLTCQVLASTFVRSWDSIQSDHEPTTCTRPGQCISAACASLVRACGPAKPSPTFTEQDDSWSIYRNVVSTSVSIWSRLCLRAATTFSAARTSSSVRTLTSDRSRSAGSKCFLPPRADQRTARQTRAPQHTQESAGAPHFGAILVWRRSFSARESTAYSELSVNDDASAPCPPRSWIRCTGCNAGRASAVRALATRTAAAESHPYPLIPPRWREALKSKWRETGVPSESLELRHSDPSSCAFLANSKSPGPLRLTLAPSLWPLRSRAVAGVSQRVRVGLGPVLAFRRFPARAPSPPAAAAAAWRGRVGRVGKCVWSKGANHNQLEREPLGHLGMSRGDGRGACERTWSS